MKTPKANREEVKGNTLSVLLTKPQKEWVQKESERLGLTMSSWARMVLSEKINQK